MRGRVVNNANLHKAKYEKSNSFSVQAKFYYVFFIFDRQYVLLSTQRKHSWLGTLPWAELQERCLFANIGKEW